MLSFHEGGLRSVISFQETTINFIQDLIYLCFPNFYAFLNCPELKVGFSVLTLSGDNKHSMEDEFLNNYDLGSNFKGLWTSVSNTN